MDGYVLVPESSGRPTGLDGISQAWLIHRGHAAGEGYIRGFVGSDGDVFAVENESGGRLGGGLAVALHEPRIAGKRNRCAGITFGDVDLEEAEGGTAVFEEYRKTSSPLRLPHGGGGRRSIFLGSAIECSNLLQRIAEDKDVVRHIRRDPHKRISMDSLQ